MSVVREFAVCHLEQTHLRSYFTVELPELQNQFVLVTFKAGLSGDCAQQAAPQYFYFYTFKCDKTLDIYQF